MWDSERPAGGSGGSDSEPWWSMSVICHVPQAKAGTAQLVVFRITLCLFVLGAVTLPNCQ